MKFGGLVLINVTVAVVGTAVLETALRKMIPPHSISGLIWKECVLSITVAALIGFGMWRTWRDSSAKWTWVVPAAWFGVGLIVAHGDVWGRLFPGSESVLVAPDMRSFFSFTVPLIRAISYSAGAQISSRLDVASGS